MSNAKSSDVPKRDSIGDFLTLEEDFLLVVIKKELSEIKNIEELREETFKYLDQCILLERLNKFLKDRVDKIYSAYDDCVDYKPSESCKDYKEFGDYGDYGDSGDN